MDLNLDMVMSIPGWLSREALKPMYDYAMKAPVAKVLEIGTYCGKSAIVFAKAMEQRKGMLICTDLFPNHVSFKNNYRDQKEPTQSIPNPLMLLWSNLRKLNLQDYVITVKGDHKHSLDSLVGTYGVVYIDGGHHLARVMEDSLYAWKHTVKGGYLIYHDYGHPELPDVKICVDALCQVWGSPIIDKIGTTVIIQKL